MAVTSVADPGELRVMKLPGSTFTNHTSYILTYLLSHDINAYHVTLFI